MGQGSGREGSRGGAPEGRPRRALRRAQGRQGPEEEVVAAAATGDPAVPDCRICGACCAYSREWPRLTLEDDEAIARIPPRLLDDAAGRMRCEGDRCLALAGEVGVATSCSIYEARPEVCRACEPGDDACTMARAHFGLG
ncbi:MAG: YkgJ family cysteine cluster protein [Rhodospirillaceae bacterium]|nr:YkgJ family cysteine cluster protein [Rhodospirillaceae bacterium]